MNELQSKVAELGEAKTKAAIGEEFAREYIEFKGIRFYYKTVAHAWIIPAVFGRMQEMNDFDRGMIAAYLLTMSAEEVRSKAMQQLEEGRLKDAALDFFIGKGIVPADLEQINPERLLEHPYSSKHP